MALIIVTALFGVFAIVCFTLIILLGGLRIFAKSKDPEEPDKAKEQAVPVKEDSSSSKDVEKSLSLQPGLDHPARQNADLSAVKSIVSESDGADTTTASALDGSNRGNQMTD